MGLKFFICDVFKNNNYYCLSNKFVFYWLSALATTILETTKDGL